MEKKTVEQVAQEKMAEITKAKEARAAQEKKDAEARGAAPAPSAEKPKTKEEPKKDETKDKETLAKEAREKAEEQAKEDTRVLETPDEKLSDKEKTHKAELLEIKKKQDAEVKEKTKQDKIDARIGELTGQLKDLKRDKDADKEKIAILESKIAELQKPPAAKEAEEFKKAEKAQIAKYVEEDKDKPREERREMTNDELNDWLVEDYTAAQEWLTERSIRRYRERETVKQEKVIREKARDLLAKQQVHAKKTQEAHSELNTEVREAELIKQGKTPKEIHEILCQENEKYRICSEILKEDPSKYLLAEDGPALVVAEMEKRLKAKPPEKKKDEKQETQEERDARIREEAAEAERQRQANLDEGPASSKGKEKEPEDTRSAFQKEQEKIAARKGISPARLKELNERRKKIPGATQYKD